jgi:putative peptide maturation system protein
MLSEIVTLLHELHREQLEPVQGKQRLAELKIRFPAATMKLFWEQQQYDQSLHYEVMLRSVETAGTITVGFSPSIALPWPVRGVHRWKEADLLRVNETVMGIQQAMSHLDFIWNQADILTRLIDTCLIEQACDEFVLTNISETELQDGMDAFRRAKGLLTVEQTERWMLHHGTSQDQLEEIVKQNLIFVRLRDHVCSENVDPYFTQHASDFDTALAATIEFDDLATAIAASLEIAGGRNFFEVAQIAFLARGTPTPSETFQRFSRFDEPWAATVFTAEIADLIGPITVGSRHTLLKVLRHETATLTEKVREKIKQKLFSIWLAKRREVANIEWFWGTRKENRTDAAG